MLGNVVSSVMRPLDAHHPTTSSTTTSVGKPPRRPRTSTRYLMDPGLRARTCIDISTRYRHPGLPQSWPDTPRFVRQPAENRQRTAVFNMADGAAHDNEDKSDSFLPSSCHYRRSRTLGVERAICFLCLRQSSTPTSDRRCHQTAIACKWAISAKKAVSGPRGC